MGATAKGIGVAAVLLQYLGWRCGSVLRLETEHVQDTGTRFHIQCTHCKTGATEGFPSAVVSFTQVPKLHNMLAAWIAARKAAGHRLLFDIPEKGSLARWFNSELAQFFDELAITATGWTSHCFRRGTASVLVALGVSERKIKTHLGWSLESSMLSVYDKGVTATTSDKLFFYDVLH